MKKYWLILAAIILVLFSYIYVRVAGDEYTYRYQAYPTQDMSGPFSVSVDEGSEARLEILDSYRDGNSIVVKLRGHEPGKAYVKFDIGENQEAIFVFYVHDHGIITHDDFFGDFNGSFPVRIGFTVFMILLLVYLIHRYRKMLQGNMYQYKCILLMGLIVFVIGDIFFSILRMVNQRQLGLLEILRNALDTLGAFALFTFPVIVLVSIYIIGSNIKLMCKEGRTWRNMLGAILGVMLCFAALAPEFLSSFLQSTSLIDVHRWTGTGRFVGMFIENACGAVVVYFECILLGTIIVAVKAARHVPSFDKDYILIHGCQIRKDGTLTKLLQSRTDRAIEFAGMQEEKTGKRLVFVPSGGQGSDEVISEAEAISNYLKEKGIPQERILPEDQSKNTDENIRNAVKLIREHAGGEQKRIAFSTTNYHVFRTGLLASEQGVKMEGIGSKTKRYFWINAFVREFIATLVREAKTHFLVFGILLLIDVAAVLMTYFSNVILS